MKSKLYNIRLQPDEWAQLQQIAIETNLNYAQIFRQRVFVNESTISYLADLKNRLDILTCKLDAIETTLVEMENAIRERS